MELFTRTLKELTEESLRGTAIALFSAGGSVFTDVVQMKNCIMPLIRMYHGTGQEASELGGNLPPI